MVASKKFGSKVQLNYLASGDISYYIVYKISDKTIFKKVGKKSEGINETKCINLRNQILSEIRHGIDISQKSIKNLDFNKLAEIYFISNEAHNKSNRKYQLMYEKHIKNYFGSVVVSKLNDDLIYELQALKKAEMLSDSTINIIVKLIRRIIGFSIKKGIIPYSPFKNIKLFKVNNSRLRYLSQKEIEELYKAIEDDITLTLFVKIALTTGARANSILSIQKKDINLENRTITLKDFKRNNSYLGYINNDLYDLIKNHTEDFSPNSHLVSSNGTALNYQKIYIKLSAFFSSFNKGLAKEDRANRVVIHTLRHTFASHLAISGVSIQKIQKLMNHKDIKQTLKYAKLNQDSGRDYIEELYKGKKWE